MDFAEYIKERDRLLTEWQAKKFALEQAKAAEMEIRKKVVTLMHDPAKSGKTETFQLGSGYKVKLKVPIYYSFVKDENKKLDRDRLDLAIDTIENDSDEGLLIAKKLVRWNPELSVTEYKNLPDRYRQIIDDVLITSEGAPSLEIVEP